MKLQIFQIVPERQKLLPVSALEKSSKMFTNNGAEESAPVPVFVSGKKSGKFIPYTFFIQSLTKTKKLRKR